MKKIKLEFRKEVISTLSGNELAKIQGGHTAFSYNSCPTVDMLCAGSGECSDQDSWQTKCLSDVYNTQTCDTNLCEKPVGPVEPGSCGCATYEGCETIFTPCEVQL